MVAGGVDVAKSSGWTHYNGRVTVPIHKDWDASENLSGDIAKLYLKRLRERRGDGVSRARAGDNL
jgi:hypothetical protein